MSPLKSEDATFPRPIIDRPNRDPATDHPGRSPSETAPHPTASLRIPARRLRVRVLRSLTVAG